jgi:hypothetical protein
MFRQIHQILLNTVAILELLRPPHPTRIALELPTVTRKGVKMANYELQDDDVATVSIKTVSAGGVSEPVPAGDVFSVVSSNPASLQAVIGKDANGNPAVILTPLVQASPGLTVTVSDSAGLAVAIQAIDIVPDNSPKNIVLDLADAVLTSQPAPAAPGP